jgi:NADH:ubiquinone oxidoreductase subunit F (NADH-binding)/(2Fe-2S) ferredoxin
MKIQKASDLAKIKTQGITALSPATARITVGSATCGLSKGAGKVFEALKYEIKKQKSKAEAVSVGCNGLCYAEPIVEVIQAGKPRITYGNVTVERVGELVQSIKTGKVLTDLALVRHDEEAYCLNMAPLKYVKGKLPKAAAGIKEYRKHDFFKNQLKLVSKNAGTVSPERIEEYIALDGYKALAKALTEMSPKDVLQEVIASKLRGRGGAGFPTGIKWQACRQAPENKKYIVCNGSEGDPEIAMHRSFLESDPHTIIEGMALAGYAVGADEGYIYVNDRYVVALERLEEAIKQAEQAGLLGKNIMGTTFAFALKVKRGGGAYVCGEETALLNALEGLSGEPRPRPPFPAEKGLFEKPTVVNNLETLANIPLIVLHGGKWFSKIGTTSSTGTKIVALSGNVAQSGWVEVPLGTPVKTIIETFGKGTGTGRKVKAFQTGGPSGGVLPAAFLNIKLDYDQLTKAGSLLGSGGLLVMDEGTDMLDMAKFLTDFFADETCGKCSTCREGVKRLQEIIGSIMQGYGTREHLNLVKRMAAVMADTSACALGKTAAIPFLSVLKHFPKEVESKLVRKGA